MKLKAIILGIIAVVLLSACYPLVSPMQTRVNPNDDQNYVPVATDFNAEYVSSQNEIHLSWETLNPDYDYQRNGYLVIRKTGSAPVNIFDGTPVGDPTGPDDNTMGDVVDTDPDNDWINGAQEGYVTYYGLFAFWREDDSGNNIYVEWNENRIYNTDGYVFSGPVVTSVGVTRTITLDVLDDRYITDAGQWFDNNNLALDVSGMVGVCGSVIVFDTAELEGATIQDAGLTLTNAVAFTGMSPVIRQIMESWDTDTEWDWFKSDNFVDTTYNIDFTINNTAYDDTNTFIGTPLNTMLQNWADGENNYGMRIYIDSAATDFNFSFWSDNSGAGPVLEVTYLNE